MGLNKGFTLLELIIVIAIIGILATLGLTSFTGAQQKARDTKRKGDLKAIQNAVEQYFTDNGGYPDTGGAWWGVCSDFGSHADTGVNGYIPNLAPKYIQRLPHDPRENQAGLCSATSSCYLYKSNVVDYKLLANCTPETISTPNPSDPFYDPIRQTTAFQVSSSDVSYQW